MSVVIVGTNHRLAPIALRERLAVQEEQLPSIFGSLRENIGASEVAVLSTCNRVELYACVTDVDGSVKRMQGFLSAHGGIELPKLKEHSYAYGEPASVRHLFSVASGLDSMALGESEILQQVKRAYELARMHSASGKILNRLFEKALNTAKAVRSQTGISRGACSVGSVAVELAQKIFGELSTATVLLIGAGKLGELTVSRLGERGVRDLRIMNRSWERAIELAARVGAKPFGLEQLPAQLLEADIVITSTSAPNALLHRREVAAAMHGRRQRSLCIVDLGVPRNVEPVVGVLENVYLFDVDDFEGLLFSHAQERQKAAEAAEAIIEHKVRQFIARQRRKERIEDLGTVTQVAS